MGSLSPSGLKIPQQDTRYRHIGSLISETSVTGIALNNTIENTSQSVEREKFTANGLVGGNLEYDVTRKISGIHTSVSHRESVLRQNKTALQIASGILGADALGPMETVTERKIFFLETDRNKSSNFANWTIFNSSGIPVGASEGTTDIDISPNATFNNQG
jgi:hypothetical protein